MSYTFPVIEPGVGYVNNNLVLPKMGIRLEPFKAALTFQYGEVEVFDEEGQPLGTRPDTLELWDETRHHIIVPREFIDAAHYHEFGFDFIDHRPQTYPYADIQDSIGLRDEEQVAAFSALMMNEGGTLNLACVAGGTVLNLNRGGKGFKMTIGEAYKRFAKKGRYKWDLRTPTYVRAKVENEIRLIRLRKVLYKGYRHTLHLILEDGKSLYLTSDHEVLTPDGYVQAGDLMAGQEVLTEGLRGSARKKKQSYKRIGGFKHHPHSRYQSRSWVLEEHRAIAEASLNKMTLEEFKSCCLSGDVGGLQFLDPAKVHVHHADGDVSNNSLDNLEVLEKEAHLSHHRPGYQAFGNIPTPVKVARVGLGTVEKVYDLVCDEPHNFVANGIVVHNCGKGKTVLALKLAGKMKVPTIIIVNTTALLEQWRQEVAKFLDVSSIGIVQGDTLDWEHPIVIAMVHTLSFNRERWPMEFRRYFGLVFYDEGHHMSAPVFVRSADLFFGRRYCLTATATRTDGLQKIYQHHLGRVIHKNLSQELIPDTYFYRLKWEFDERYKMRVVDSNGEISIPRVRTYLGELDWRNELIYKHALDDLRKGRRLLILSHSVKHVDRLAEMFREKAFGSVPGVITGETPQEDRMRMLHNSNPVLGTFQLAREGLNKPTLDTLYITTPFSNPNDLQQSWGRIQRKDPNKKKPIVRVYEDLAFSCTERACRALRGHLSNMGYPTHLKRVKVEN